MHLLPLNLSCLADHADPKEGARWAVTGLEVELLPENRYRVTATDTKQLVTAEGPAIGDPNDYPTWPALESAPNGHAKALIDAKGWRGFFHAAGKVVPKRTTKPELKAVAVKIGERVSTFGATDTERTATESLRHVEGKFPPHRQILPRTRPTAAVYLDAATLSKMAGTLAKLAVPDSAGNLPGITLEILDQEKPVMLRLRNHDGSSADGLIMPMGERGPSGLTSYPLPVTKRVGVPLCEPQEVPGVAELETEVSRLKEQLADARAEIARLTAELATRDATPLAEPTATGEQEPAPTWTRPAPVPVAPVGTCTGCRKAFKYLKSSGQRCTRCLKKSPAGVVLDR